MGITYDKKTLERYFKYLRMGKKKYTLMLTFYTSVFQTVFMAVFFYYIFKEKFDFKFILSMCALFVFYMISGYFLALKNWKNMNNLYNESIEYFKENNPEFIKDILEKKQDNDK